MRNSLRQYGSGFSTLEMLIAMTIIIMTLTAVVSTASGSQSLNIDSELSGEALHLAQGELEQMQTLARKDFNLVNPTTTLQVIDGIAYTTKVTVIASSSDNYMAKEVRVSVGWVREGNRPQHVELASLVTNFVHASGGTTCNSVLSGDWTHPYIVNAVTDFRSLVATSTGIHVVSSLDAYKGKLYVTVSNTGGVVNRADPTFFIFDIAKLKSNQPALLGKLDTASTTSVGLFSVQVAEETATGTLHAFVANYNQSNWTTCTQAENCSQLQIIDVSSSTKLSRASTTNYKIPTVVGSGGQGVGNAIFYKDGYVYLGLTKTASGPEFNVIDVHDLLHPVWVGGAPVGATINAITVVGNRAYLATNVTSGEITVIDVSNPATPTILPALAFDALGGGPTIGLGQSVAVVGDNVYLGRTNVGGSPEFYALDASSTATSILPLGTSEVGAYVNGLIVRSYLAFLADETAKGFHVLNINNPASITDWAPSFAGLVGGNFASAIDCEGNDLFVGSRDAANLGYLSVITSSP